MRPEGAAFDHTPRHRPGIRTGLLQCHRRQAQLHPQITDHARPGRVGEDRPGRPRRELRVQDQGVDEAGPLAAVG